MLRVTLFALLAVSASACENSLNGCSACCTGGLVPGLCSDAAAEKGCTDAGCKILDAIGMKTCVPGDIADAAGDLGKLTGDAGECAKLKGAECTANTKCGLVTHMGMEVCTTKMLADAANTAVTAGEDAVKEAAACSKLDEATCGTNAKCGLITLTKMCTTKVAADLANTVGDIGGAVGGVVGDLATCATLKGDACTANTKCALISKASFSMCTTTDAAAKANDMAAKLAPFENCAKHTTEQACAADSTCGHVAPFVFCTTKEAATKGQKAFDDASATLKGLGATVKDAADKLLADGKSMADKIKGMTGKDVEAIIGTVKAEVEKGKGMAADAAKDMMDKIKSADAWGAVESWGAEKVKEAGDLMSGLESSDLGKIAKETFNNALEDFGKVSDWAKDQASTLATKFKETVPDLSEAVGAQLNEMKGFLNGFEPEDLKKITKDSFAAAKDSFKEIAGKVGAFAKDQADEIGKKVKEMVGDVKTITADKVKELDALLGTLDANDLKDLADDAIKELSDKAVKAMGGAKAAAAFGADQIKKMSQAAKDAINGADLQALKDSAVEKVKAALGCDDDSADLKCPGAVADITVFHDKAKESAADILKKVNDALAKAGKKASDKVKLIQSELPATASSTARRQRRLSTSSSGNSQTVVRVESATNADANAAGSSAAAATGGQAQTVSVTATDGNAIAGASTNGPIALGAVLTLAVAITRIF
jgi:hypothetical protein